MLEFVEIEHKFLVDASFDLDRFARCAKALKPDDEGQVDVRDSYYVINAMPGHVVRHRVDREIQQLSVKSVAPDNERRLEVNLELDQSGGDQQRAVEAFLAPMGILWRGTIEKKIHVFYFADCEVVHYEARAGGKSVACVEFEAKAKSGESAALEAIRRYEVAFGFADATRCRQSLFEIMFKDTMPAGVVRHLNAKE
ncbi:MAG: hypothetical protein RIQ81_2331 [Pseudomonadota bacterium]|jgi:hypothetical protein